MKTHAIHNLILLAMLTTGASAFSAEDTAPVATPATAETMTTANPSPTGSSFFSPKTEDDVNQMANVSDAEFSDAATAGDE